MMGRLSTIVFGSSMSLPGLGDIHMDNKKLLTGFFKNPSSRVLKEGLLFCFCCIWSCSSQTEPANLSDICINTIVKKRIEQIVGKIVNRFFFNRI